MLFILNWYSGCDWIINCEDWKEAYPNSPIMQIYLRRWQGEDWTFIYVGY